MRSDHLLSRMRRLRRSWLAWLCLMPMCGGSRGRCGSPTTVCIAVQAITTLTCPIRSCSMQQALRPARRSARCVACMRRRRRISCLRRHGMLRGRAATAAGRRLRFLGAAATPPIRLRILHQRRRVRVIVQPVRPAGLLHQRRKLRVFRELPRRKGAAVGDSIVGQAAAVGAALLVEPVVRVRRRGRGAAAARALAAALTLCLQVLSRFLTGMRVSHWYEYIYLLGMTEVRCVAPSGSSPALNNVVQNSRAHDPAAASVSHLAAAPLHGAL